MVGVGQTLQYSGGIKLSGMQDPAREVFENPKLAGTVFDIYADEAAEMGAF
jgi:hypothetical protein